MDKASFSADETTLIVLRYIVPTKKNVSVDEAGVSADGPSPLVTLAHDTYF